MANEDSQADAAHAPASKPEQPAALRQPPILDKTENYVEWVMDAARPLIKLSNPSADKFEYLGSRDFANGKITMVGFEFFDESEKDLRRSFHYPFDDNVQPLRHFRSERQIIDTFGSTRKVGFVEILLRADHVTGIIALLILFFIVMLIAFGRTPPEIIVNAFTLVIGFYFGRQKS